MVEWDGKAAGGPSGKGLLAGGASQEALTAPGLHVVNRTHSSLCGHSRGDKDQATDSGQQGRRPSSEALEEDAEPVSEQCLATCSERGEDCWGAVSALVWSRSSHPGLHVPLKLGVGVRTLTGGSQVCFEKCFQVILPRSYLPSNSFCLCIGNLWSEVV